MLSLFFKNFIAIKNYVDIIIKDKETPEKIDFSERKIYWRKYKSFTINNI